MSRVLEKVAALAVTRPRVVLGVIVLLAVAGVVGAATLRTDAGTETLVDPDSPEARATERFGEQFGDDALVVAAREPLRTLILSQDLQSLFELETCLAGGTDLGQTLPRRPDPLPEVCEEIEELAPAQVIFGPSTFLYQATSEIQRLLQGQNAATEQAAQRAERQAREDAAAQGLGESEQAQAAAEAGQAIRSQSLVELFSLAQQYGLPLRVPSLDDPEFVSRVVFDPEAPAGTPKERFAYLFPSNDSALISARLRPGLSDDERSRAVELFQRAIADERFALSEGDYVVSGVPAVVDGLSGAIRGQLALLLVAAAIVMALALAVLLPPPLRLLPLGVALTSAAILFGLVKLTGGALTIAAIAMLPVLVGLAVDYAIQLQARFNEARESGDPPGRAAVTAAGAGGPVIGLACLATIAGFAAFALSPSPLVRSFGLLLVGGIAISFVVALTGGFAALALAGWRGPAGPGERRFAPRLEAARTKFLIRAGAIGRRGLALAISSPRRVLGAAALLAACGWIAAAGTEVETDVRDLAPGDLRELRDLRELEETTGISGEVNVVVRSQDLTDPALIRWMRNYQRRVLSRNGYSGDNPSCADAKLCPAVSLTDLFSGSDGQLTRERVAGLFAVVPPYFSQAVVARDPETGALGDTANIAFGIRAQPLGDQEKLIDDLRAQVDPPGPAGPPQGTVVEVTGLTVLAAEANGDLAASRWWLPPAGLLAVALVLIVVLRSMRWGLVPLIPVLFATGWSALTVAILGVSLNPMSATLGALVIAIATEFSVILALRFRAERGTASLGEALRATYSRTGVAVLASGLTVIAGFAVLAVAGIPLFEVVGLVSVAPVLRDFGLVTIVDLSVALAGVMLVLPAALTWAEEGFAIRAPSGQPGRSRLPDALRPQAVAPSPAPGNGAAPERPRPDPRLL